MIKAWFYRLSARFLQWLSRLLFKAQIDGREHIPLGEGFLLVARHRSYWDIPLIIAALGPRHRIYFVARRTLSRNWLLRPFIEGFTIVIDREHFRLQDYRQISRALAEQRIVGIFPEGTTLPTETIRGGVVRFAERSGGLILPIKVTAQGPYPPRYPFGFPRVQIRIGRPFHLGQLERELSGDESRQERYARLSRALMERIDRAGGSAQRPVVASRGEG